MAPEAVGAAEAAAGSRAAGRGRAIASKRKRPPARGSGSTPATKPEHIPTTDELADGITSKKLEDAEPAAAPAPASWSTPEPVSTGAGIVLGVFGWALAVNYLRGGMPQVRGYLSAKFLNKPGSSGGTVASGAGAAATWKPAPTK